MPGNPIYPPLSQLALSLPPRPSRPWATAYPSVPGRTPAHPRPPTNVLQPHPPHHCRCAVAPTPPAHTATRATPQPYFFHSVLSIDQVLNFRVHPSRASTSSSSASSGLCLLLLCAACSSTHTHVRARIPSPLIGVLFHFSSTIPPPLPPIRSSLGCPTPLCLIKRTH